MNYDICIVGAGVAGSTMAAYLGRHGLNVALVERKWTEPDEIIGELLQPSGVMKLRAMGFGHALEGIDAQPVNGYVMYLGNEPHQLSYPGASGEPVNGFGFRYGRFVQNLRKLSGDMQNVAHIEGTVKQLLLNADDEIEGVKYQNAAGEVTELKATLTIVSQGSMSSLRGKLNNAPSITKGFMIGVVLEDCPLPFANYGHVFMAYPAPILAYPVGSNKIRVLIDFPGELPVMKGEELRNFLIETTKPQLPEGLQSSFEKSVKTAKLKGKPTHLLASRPKVIEGAMLLGDALNMRHPTTGSGMTVALTDVKDFGDRIISMKAINKKAVKDHLIEFYKERHKENATVNILAYALYCVFRHDILRKACFSYLKRGGKFSAEPMSILSGISRSRSTLLKHFFAVAWLAVVQQQKPFPTPRRIARSLRVIRDTLAIIVPLIRDEVPRVEVG